MTNIAHSRWLKNCWYVIAWNHEIPAADSNDIFHRVVLGEPVLVFREASGKLVAMEDRCCHRHAPLSKGKREGDCIRCGYHGLKFNAQGACVEAPGIAIIPEKARVKTYPIALKGNWVFVWMGDAAKADEKLLPDNFSNNHPDWRNKPGYLHYDTPYLLICDNLLDFSHLSFVHEKTLGGSPAIAQAVPSIEKVPGATPSWPQMGIKVSRQVPNVPPPPFYQKFRSFDSNLDRWFVYDFVLPATLLMHSGGKPIQDEDLSNAVQLHSCQTLTPETENSTHYFFQQSHRVNAAHALSEEAADAITDSIFNSLVTAFNEDRDTISSQYQNILLSQGKAMLPLAMDSALTQFRRLLDARMKLEES